MEAVAPGPGADPGGAGAIATGIFVGAELVGVGGIDVGCCDAGGLEGAIVRPLGATEVEPFAGDCCCCCCCCWLLFCCWGRGTSCGWVVVMG